METYYKNKNIEISNWKTIRFSIDCYFRQIYFWFAPYFCCFLLKIELPNWIKKKDFNKCYKFGINFNINSSWLLQFGIELCFIKSKTIWFHIFNIETERNFYKENRYLFYDYKTMKKIEIEIKMSESIYQMKYFPFIKKKYYGYWVNYLDNVYINGNSGFGGNLPNLNPKSVHINLRVEKIINDKLKMEIVEYYYQSKPSNKAILHNKLTELINV